MSDWKDGDLALCIKGGKISKRRSDPGQQYPEVGKVYVVCGHSIENFASPTGKGSEKMGALYFYDAPLNRGFRIWAEERFIKVTPPDEMIDEEEKKEVKTPEHAV